MAVSRIVKIVKSLTARDKEKVVGRNLWTRGFYANTVGQFGSEAMIREYVKNQGTQYTKLHTGQLKLDL